MGQKCPCLHFNMSFNYLTFLVLYHSIYVCLQFLLLNFNTLSKIAHLLLLHRNFFKSSFLFKFIELTLIFINCILWNKELYNTHLYLPWLGAEF
jgi:hypothetical protein